MAGDEVVDGSDEDDGENYGWDLRHCEEGLGLYVVLVRNFRNERVGKRIVNGE